MAVLGKRISQSAGGRSFLRGWRAIAVTVLALLGVGVQPARASQDPLVASQWALQQIGAPTAWRQSTGAGIRIGIVDSGVFAAQEDLAGKVVAATDCIDTQGDPGACHGAGQDDTGHGTLMAGIAAATKDNGRGVAGVAPDAQLVVAKVLSDDGGSILDVEAGIRWVVQHGAQVVNLSLADNPMAQRPLDLSFESAVEEAWAAGAVPVVAAGNVTSLGPSQEDFGDLDALAVGATDVRGVLAPYSNPLTSAKWGVVAPGGSATGDGRDVVSTWHDPSAPNATNLYAFRSGASVAAAHVSGVVALLLAQGFSPADAVQQIISTARPVPCGLCCHGLVNAAAAVASPPSIFVAGAGGAAPVPATTRPTRPATPPPTNPTVAAPVPASVATEPPHAVASPAPDDEVGAVMASARVTGWSPYLRPIVAWAFIVIIILTSLLARTHRRQA
ncbi:MAG: S8 family serine peptidase [Acidimicrobiia bacterium]|nr:S8 family serine peptidase [Acidimicrobiia bacterium]